MSRFLLASKCLHKLAAMPSAILVNSAFDAVWPFCADYAHREWGAQGAVEFIRVGPEDTRPVNELLASPSETTRLLSFGIPLTSRCVEALSALREAAIIPSDENKTDEDARKQLQARGVRLIKHTSEGFWGQSVSEFALALTLCGLRRIPQTHHNILTSHEDWDYDPPEGRGRPGVRGQQFGDDPCFVNGTVEGKRVRVVGAGNIAARYASFVHFLGAEVAAWDPFAAEPAFHRAGTRREHFLDRLITDADIFAPMLPLTDATRGLVTATHIEALPKGCLVVLATRADIVDVPTLRRRVLNDELALAADVFDIEPLPMDDPLLGRHNVVHTPHNAGRTRQANERFAAMLLEQFAP